MLNNHLTLVVMLKYFLILSTSLFYNFYFQRTEQLIVSGLLQRVDEIETMQQSSKIMKSI